MAGKSLLRNDTLVPWSCSQHCGENLYQGPHGDTKDNSTGLALHLWTSRALRKTLYRGPKSRPDGLGMLLIQKIWTRRPRLQGLDVWMWLWRSLVQCFPQGPRSSQREGGRRKGRERVRKKKTVTDSDTHLQSHHLGNRGKVIIEFEASLCYRVRPCWRMGGREDMLKNRFQLSRSSSRGVVTLEHRCECTVAFMPGGLAKRD